MLFTRRNWVPHCCVVKAPLAFFSGYGQVPSFYIVKAHVMLFRRRRGVQRHCEVKEG